MNILLFHATLLPALKYGGTERVVLWLARGLQKRGHEVTVAALAGSRLPEGISLLPIDPNDPSPESLLGRVPEGVELVHFMAPVGESLVSRLAMPVLQTIHGNGKPGEKFSRNSVFLSSSHASRHGASCFVYNGIDPHEFYVSSKKKPKTALFLSKTSWSVKNLKGAMRVISRTPDWKLEIAGGSRPMGARLRACLSPRFSWKGEVDSQQKAKLLSEASCLLFPTRWPEPFGLVVIEALLSGTPVVGSQSGALPELLTPLVGHSLSLTDSSAWTRALEHVAEGGFKAKDLRDYAAERFSYLRMAEGYETCYKSILNGKSLNEQVPESRKGWIPDDCTL